jgi:protein involved in polysaccharide export with SLBB domain
MASRHELDSLAKLARASAKSASITAEQRSAQERYAAEAERRLVEGDFQPGDRIIVDVSGDSTVRDTFTVQPSQALVLPHLPPIPLHGVLRSELRDYLATRLREFVKDTLVRASPLLLVGVIGEVAHPGYYRMSLETSVGDALMLAGGPTHDAELTRMFVRRGNRTFIPSREVRSAMVRRLPLVQLGLDDGDEVVIPEPHTRNWSLLFQVAGLSSGLVALFALRRR